MAAANFNLRASLNLICQSRESLQDYREPGSTCILSSPADGIRKILKAVVEHEVRAGFQVRLLDKKRNTGKLRQRLRPVQRPGVYHVLPGDKLESSSKYVALRLCFQKLHGYLAVIDPMRNAVANLDFGFRNEMCLVDGPERCLAVFGPHCH